MEAFWRIGVIALILLFLAACAGPATPTTGPTRGAVAPTATAAVTSAPAAVPTKPAAATPTPATQIKRGGTLRAVMGSYSGYGTLDPHIHPGGGSDTLFTSVFNSVTQLFYNEQTKKWEVRPMLATSWEFTDPKTFVIKLRKGVKFHDGSDWNADVLLFNLDRMKNHKRSISKEMVMDIADAQKVDDYTVRLLLTGPTATLPSRLSSGGSLGRTYIVSKAGIEKMGEEKYGTKPTGTGPFEVTEWMTDDHVTIKKFDGYWEMGEDGKPLPYLDGIVFRFIKDMSVAATELRTGNIDITGPTLAPVDLLKVKDNPDLVVLQPPSVAKFVILGLNARQGVFADNLKLRQAVAYGIDRDAMVKTLGMGLGEPACYYWAPGQLGYDPSIPCYKSDQAKAKQSFQDAKVNSPLDIVLLAFSTPDRVKFSEVVKAQLDAIGFRVKIEGMERVASIQRAALFDFDIYLWGRNFQADPDALSRDLHSTGQGAYSGWRNPEMDKCMEEGRAELDEAKRAETYKRCQRLIYDDAYNVLTWLEPQNIVHNKKVKGLSLDWTAWHTQYIWLDK
ncbi:MAG: ABC transporter substrate-binding protein [Bacteroidetes bacterium]|nr:ABC transporter substrate-binding protein [Bacteroidota bacterium]MCL5025072.1 ABC transporter substrate-binding protein [Chloroflexota bacterium]